MTIQSVRPSAYCTSDSEASADSRRLKVGKVHLSAQAVRMGAESQLEQVQYSWPIPGRNRFCHIW